MKQLRPPFENQKFKLKWRKFEITSNAKKQFYFPNLKNLEEKDNKIGNQNEQILKLIHEYNKLQEEIFWGLQSDTIRIIIFNEIIDVDPENAFKELSKNQLISYYHNVNLLFKEHFFNHLEFVIISPKNRIIYNFKNQKIQSTFENDHLKKLVNIFIKDNFKINQYQVEINQDLLLDECFSNNIELQKKYKNINLQSPLQEVIDDKQTIIWTIDQKGLNLYLCFEPDSIIYYGQLNENYQKHGRGLFFQTNWNECNPNFIILQGNFKNGKKDGLFLKFSSRSQNLQCGNIYQDDEFKKQVDLEEDGKVKKEIEIIKKEVLEKSPQEPPKKRRIIIMEEGVILNNIEKPLIDKPKTNQSDIFVKYNQQYNQNDKRILLNLRTWLNSSIIDGYAMYLQKKQTEEAFQSNKPIEKLSTFVIDSTYLTSAQIDYKIVTSLRALCYEYKGITIFDVFKNIAVIVNSNNSHWFFVLVKRQKLQEESLVGFLGQYQLNFHILDSMSGNKQKYLKVCQKIFDLFSYHLELGDNYKFYGVNNITVENVIQQNDGSSCGDHTCYFMYSIFNNIDYRERNQKQIEQVQQMRKILFTIIFENQ